MEKKNMADKLAEKTFNSPEFQKSWKAHMQAFGPILDPAFADDYQARVNLTSALNKIGRRDIKGGIKKLETLHDSCVMNVDKAAWLFFMGLCYEMSGMREQMISCYQQAGEYGHRFYLPYLKLAKCAHSDAAFEAAEYNYHLAIDCLDENLEEEKNRVILASVYTNLASCLTMMHRYIEAEQALEISTQILPVQQGRAATKAILYAAKGDKEKVSLCLEELETQAPQMLSTAQKMTDEILSGEHAHFSEVYVDDAEIGEFWNWFTENESYMIGKLSNREFDEVFRMLQIQLSHLFPFVKRDPDLGVVIEENFVEITFADFFMVSLNSGYNKLLNACPEDLKLRWIFKIEH